MKIDNHTVLSNKYAENLSYILVSIAQMTYIFHSYYSVTLKMAENVMKNRTRRNVNQFRKINVQEGINVQAGKFFRINKRTGPNKLRTGGKFDSKIINVPVRLLETRE